MFYLLYCLFQLCPLIAILLFCFLLDFAPCLNVIITIIYVFEKQCSVCTVSNRICFLVFFTFLLLLCICLFAHHMCMVHTPCLPQRDQKLYVLLILASVPYMSLFVYDTVCIGSPGTTSASVSASAHVRVKVKLARHTGITAKATSPTLKTRGELPGGECREELARRLPVLK